MALALRLENSARFLALREPEEALAVLDHSLLRGRATVALLKGLGDGVAESAVFDSLRAQISRLGADLLLRLVAVSERFGESLVASMNVNVGRWRKVLLQVLDGRDVEACRGVRRRLLPLIGDAVAAEAIPSMLVGVAGSELADLAVELASRGKLRSKPFLTTFAEVARKSAAAEVVREAVAEQGQSAEEDLFLLELTDFSVPDVEWLLGLHDSGLAGRLLTALLAESDSVAIRSVLSTSGRVLRVLSALRSVSSKSAPQAARVLTLGLIGNGAGLDFGFEVVRMLRCEERRSLETWLLRELLCSARLGDDRLPHALSEFSAGLSPGELVSATTAPSIGARRVSENLEALNTASRETRNRVLGVVDVLSRRLVERRREELSAAAYRAWAALLGDAAHSERQAKATATVFGFALRRPSSPVSPLLVASFPTVYQELPRLKKLGLSSGALPFLFYWLGEKKPKRARRELVDVLVRRFLYSSWPPADLVIAVLEADAGAKVLKRVRKRAGSRYLRRIEKDASRLDGDLRCRVLACLADTA